MKEGPRGLEMRFGATLENIDAAVQEAQSYLARRIADTSIRFGVLTGFREALLNAVLHGCRGDSSLRVRCRIRQEGGDLRIEVADPGEGFDWRSVLSEPPAASSEGGRGLPILRAFFDNFEYNESGNRLEFSKRVSPLPPSRVGCYVGTPSGEGAGRKGDPG